MTRYHRRGYLTAVYRLALGSIRICRRCGRGRAELLTEDGEALVVRLDPGRARILHDLGRDDVAAPDLPWMTALAVADAETAGRRVTDVVLDAGPHGLRGLVSWLGDGTTDVIACEPQEALEWAMRTTAPVFATDEALHREPDPDDRENETVH